ncbi:MAG: S-layer homology domain-containing protein, partial [Clostridia bacterium]|nr:S-layer homology domain-containing protein [Clostridia bacterium]
IGGGGGGGTSFPSTTFPDSIVNESINKESNTTDTITEEAQAAITGHWAEKEATALAQKGIIKGKNGSYALEDNVTRAEFTAMLVRVFELDELTYNGDFADVSGNEWYAGVISAAYNQGLFDGSNGKAYPNNNITREEAVKLLVCFIEKYNGQIESTEIVSFKDSAAISEWAEKYVSKAVSGGFIKGMGNNEFMPKGTLTRAQAMVMLYRVIFDA